jgi:hypothetical protein
MLKTGPFSSVSPMAFVDAECEAKWNRQYMSGVANRLSLGAKIMAVLILVSHMLGISNGDNQSIVQEHRTLFIVLIPVVFLSMTWIAVTARKREDTSEGIHGLFMATVVILAVSTTITTTTIWASHNDALVSKGDSSIALAAWAQANSSEQAWFYTFLLLLCVWVQGSARMAFNLACMSVVTCTVSSTLTWSHYLSMNSILTRSLMYLGGCVVPVVSGCYRAERQVAYRFPCYFLFLPFTVSLIQDRRHFLDRILLEERSRLLEQLSKQERRVIEAETRADAEHNVVSLLCHEIR